MNKTAKVALIGVVVGLVTAFAPPAAQAAHHSTRFGCSYDTVTPPNANGPWVGELNDFSVTRDGEIPVDATVYCKIQQDGGVDLTPTYSYSGVGVQAGVDTVSFTPTTEFALVGLCQRTVYADGVDTGWECDYGDLVFYFPPPWVVDEMNLQADTINGILTGDVDPQLCPLLAAHAGTYGPVTVQPDGDVYVSPDPTDGVIEPAELSPVYDCPPYGNF